MDRKRKTLYLCGGLQSSGSTLVSWCFLQRRDMDGVLDGENDLLPRIDPGLGKPFAWYKTTISCFRLSELTFHYQREGWEVRPLLVVRDLRRVWASLLKKPYAANGITAEDPPLRLRIFRFAQDWELFRHRDWPTLQYESLLADPERALRRACCQLGLPWDDAMLTWPKPEVDIADTTWGNASFRTTRCAKLAETLAQYAGRPDRLAIGARDLDWLEREFLDFNLENGYPPAMETTDALEHVPRSAPGFEVTRRYEWETKRKPLRWLLSRLGIPYRKLIERRSIKKAA